MTPRPTAARVALALALSAGQAGAWELGRWTIDPATGATLRIDASLGSLSGTRSTAGAQPWHLVLSPDGPRLSAAAAAHCNGSLYVTAATRDVNGDGRIELARHDRLRLYIAATMRVPVARSWLAAVAIEPDGNARLLWSTDERLLPSLGELLVPPAVASRPSGDSARPLREFIVTGSGVARADGDARGPSLLALDADTGVPVTTTFDAGSRVPGGITAVDDDSDGTTDRLYLSDARHRVWQLAFAAERATPQLELRGREIAALGAGVRAGTALIHPPDVVSTSDARGPRHWELTVGTSALPDAQAAEHWLFHWREPALGEPPIHASALPELLPGGAANDASAVVDYRLHLPGPLASPVLTVDGRQLLVTAAPSASRPCRDGLVEREAGTVVAIDRRSRNGSVTSARTPPAEADAPLRAGWMRPDAADGGRLQCLLGDEPLASCPAIPRLQRRWWLRSDAP